MLIKGVIGLFDGHQEQILVLHITVPYFLKELMIISFNYLSCILLGIRNDYYGRQRQMINFINQGPAPFTSGKNLVTQSAYVFDIPLIHGDATKEHCDGLGHGKDSCQIVGQIVYNISHTCYHRDLFPLASLIRK